MWLGLAGRRRQTGKEPLTAGQEGETAQIRPKGSHHSDVCWASADQDGDPIDEPTLKTGTMQKRRVKGQEGWAREKQQLPCICVCVCT